MQRSSNLQDRLWTIRNAFRSYIDEGRVRDLMPFVGVSFAIAFAQWLLIQERLPEGLFFMISWILTLVWIAVFVAGVWKAGRPGLVMLIAAPLGAFPVVMIVLLIAGCALGGTCV